MPTIWQRARTGLAEGVARVAPRTARAIAEREGPAGLHALYHGSASWSTTAVGLLAPLGISVTDDVQREFEVARQALLDAPRDGFVYPPFWAVEDETALFLYALVRALRPGLVVETGVADGTSSALILAAMDANGEGELHSVDVTADVGVLARGHPRWTLHLIDRHDRTAFRTLCRALGPFDLFFHDSDHHYANQRRELVAAWEVLRPGGVLAMDDADWSNALRHFCAQRDLRPHLMIDRRKVTGFVVKALP